MRYKGAVIILGIFSLMALAVQQGGFVDLGQLKSVYHSMMPERVRYLVWVVKDAALNPWFYSIVGVVFVIERLIPVNKSQKIFSAASYPSFP